MKLNLSPIGFLHNGFGEKFGIPRQSGLADIKSLLVMEKEYSSPEAFRSLSEFSHLWLIWGFSQCFGQPWHPTVRPPKLGGNRRMGVFATRSPFRPNPLGLSSVKLESLHFDPEGRAVLTLRGADLADGTPIYDIKPYLPYTDSHPEAKNAWADPALHPTLQVEFAEDLPLSEEERRELSELLRQDPRPAYQEDPHRIYTMTYGGKEISFCVKENLLQVLSARS